MPRAAPRHVRLGVVLLRQDDPKKCTAAKMVRLGIARGLRRAPRGDKDVILDPYSEDVLLRGDARATGSITAIDCSWRLAEGVFAASPGAMRKSLPPLMAGNPVNYSRFGTLTTAEALAASLFILGEDERAQGILGKFVWGHTFYELNASLLADYARLEGPSGIADVLKSHGIGVTGRPGGRD